ncbi:MAG: HEPN domain-containing protein, partial [Solirubrobacterales bacterium]
MTIAERDFEGDFWIPETPNRTCRGALHVSDDGRVEVRLEDRLVEPENPLDPLPEGRDYARICGTTFDRKQLCLVDAFTINMKGNFPHGVQHPETVFANRLIVGSHEADPEVVSASLQTTNLVKFIDPLTRAIIPRQEEDSFRVVWSDLGADRSIELDGVTLSLLHVYSGGTSNGRGYIENAGLIKTTSEEPATYSTLFAPCEVLHTYVDFLSLKPGQKTELTGRTADGQGIELISTSADAKDHRNRPWLQLGDVFNEFEDTAQRWIKLAGEDKLLFAALGDLVQGHGGLMDRTLYALRFIDLHHTIRNPETQEFREEQKRKKDEVLAAVPEEYEEWVNGALSISGRPSFRIRLEETIDSFGDLFYPLLGNADLPTREERLKNFSKVARDTRNYFAHLTVDEYSITEGIDMYWFFHRIWFISRACILSDLGYSEERVAELIRKDQYFSQVARKPLRTPETEEA